MIPETEYGVPIPSGRSAPNNIIEAQCFSNAKEKQLYRIQTEYGRPHSQPFSCCIVSCGTMWAPATDEHNGSWQHVADMIAHMQKRSLSCWFRAIGDPRAGEPYEFVGAMRDHGLLVARDLGVEWVCLIDTDILPEPDLLVRLMRHQQPIIAPYIADGDTGATLGGPAHKPGTGLKPMQWVTTSMILFKTTVLNCLGENIFTGQAGEHMIWQRFWHYGHRPWLDTDTELKMARHATKNGALTLPERRVWLEQMDERRRQPADWGAQVDADDPRMVAGVYAPWLSNGKR